MNIDNLMDQIIAEGLDLKAVTKAFEDAVDRKRKNTATTEARKNVLQALRKYCMILYGAVDEGTMNEFEKTLIKMEKAAGTLGTMTKEVQSDDEKLERFLKAMGYNVKR